MTIMKKAKRSILFIEGAIPPSLIADDIAKHSTKTDIGAHSIFLGQVRSDELAEGTVRAIDYSCYPEMSEEVMHDMREEVIPKYQLNCLHIYHSLGVVEAGQICLFVFTSSKHRKNAMDACTELVERIKKDVPIWGKEIFTDEHYQWKINT